MVEFTLPPLVLFWLMMGVLGFGGWAIFTALVGLRDEAKKRWESQLIFWTGRFLLIAAASTVLILASYGLMLLTMWAVS